MSSDWSTVKKKKMTHWWSKTQKRCLFKFIMLACIRPQASSESTPRPWCAPHPSLSQRHKKQEVGKMIR